MATKNRCGKMSALVVVVLTIMCLEVAGVARYDSNHAEEEDDLYYGIGGSRKGGKSKHLLLANSLAAVPNPRPASVLSEEDEMADHGDGGGGDRYQSTPDPPAAHAGAVPIALSETCGNATDLNVAWDGEGTYSGENAGVSEVGQDTYRALRCGVVSPFSRAVWYKVGTEQQQRATCFTASTAGSSFDTVLALYRGDCETNLTCVAENDDHFGLTSEIRWEAAANETHYLLVGGSFSATGLFVLTLSAGACPEIPSNGACSNATAVRSLPYNDTARTELATAVGDGDGKVSPDCGLVSPQTKAVWYRLDPDADDPSPSCLKASARSDFPAVLAVGSGELCPSLRCVAQTDFMDHVTWQTEPGDAYFLLVGGAEDGAAGALDIHVKKGACPPNARCVDAAEVDRIPFEARGSTEFAAPPGSGTPALVCHNVDAFAPAVWYTFTGTSSDCLNATLLLRGARGGNGSGSSEEAASTTSAASLAVSVSPRQLLAVYEGDCHNLTCVSVAWTGADGSGGVAWRTVRGVRYRLLVQGPHSFSHDAEYEYDDDDDDDGAYHLRIEKSSSCPEYDRCTEAKRITEIPFLFEGSKGLATREDSESGALSCSLVSDTSLTQWFVLVGDGSCLSARIEGAGVVGGPVLAIYKGKCYFNLTCVEQTDRPGFLVTWLAGNQESYYLTVASRSRLSPGNYTLVIDKGEGCPIPQENDDCHDATPVLEFPFFDYGTNVIAAEEGYNSAALVCSFVFASCRSVWYRIAGDGRCYAATTKGSKFDTVLAVYAGPSCNRLSCIHQDGYMRSQSSGVRWRAENGTSYYVLLGGQYSAVGEFEIEIDVDECPSVPSNDRCSSATVLEHFPFTEEVNTAGATPEGFYNKAASCFLVDSSSKTVWYALTGDGTCINARVGTAFGTVLALLMGNRCADLSCIKQVEGGGIAALSWKAEKGVNYYLVLGGHKDEGGEAYLRITEHDCVTNDECALSSQIRIPAVVSGSNEFASEEGYGSPALACGAISGESITSWYRLQGNGSCAMASLASDFPGHLAVLKGDDCMSELSCVAQTDRLPDGGGGGTVAWRTEDGATYRLVVVASARRGPAVGTYNLVVTSIDCAGVSSNDFCTNATAIERLPFADEGSNEFATANGIDGFVTQGCAATAFDSRRNIFYSLTALEGNSEEERACLRASVRPLKSFSGGGTFLAVLEGDCGDLRCVGQTDSTDFPTEIAWKAEAGKQYRVMVGNRDDGAMGGPFRLEVTEDRCPENDECDDAIEIGALPFVEFARLEFRFSAAGAGNYGDRGPVLPCDAIVSGEESAAAVRAWYGVFGRGRCLRAALAADFEGGRLVVLRGDCGDPSLSSSSSSYCVAQTMGNHHNGSSSSSDFVDWLAEDGTHYKLAVIADSRGRRPVGSFVLNAMEINDCPDVFASTKATTTTASLPPAQEGDDRNIDPARRCAEAPSIVVPMQSSSLEIEGYTDPAQLRAAEIDGALTSVGTCGLVRPGIRTAWFEYLGKGRCVRVRVQLSVTHRNRGVLAVYSGPCANLTCVAQTDGGASPGELSWNARQNVVYHVLVGSYGEGMGGEYSSFRLRVWEKDCPLNDECSGAERILLGSPHAVATVSGTSVFSSLPEEGGGDPTATTATTAAIASASAWYEIVGDGTCLGASLASELGGGPDRGLDVAVFEGPCHALSCVARITAAAAGTSGLTSSWTGLARKRYKLAVINPESKRGSGDYILNVLRRDDCPVPRANHVCREATPIELSYSSSLDGGERTFLLGAPPALGSGGGGRRGRNPQRGSDLEEESAAWFVVAGNGRCLRAELEGPSSVFLEVFSGSCDDPTYVARARNNSSTSGGRVSWRSEAGLSYFLLIGGPSDMEGSSKPFGLWVEERDCPTNDRCDNAMQVDQIPFHDHGSDEFATGGQQEEGSTGGVGGGLVAGGDLAAWYRVIGEGRCLRASVTSSRRSLLLRLYEGHCEDKDSPPCALQPGGAAYGGADNLVSWWAKADATYLVAVSSLSDEAERGDFLFAIGEAEDCPAYPANDVCSNATEITSFPFSSTARTKFATAEGNRGATATTTVTSCSVITDQRRLVWFAMEGDGSCYTAAVPFSDLDTLVAVYAVAGDGGADEEACGELYCVAQTYDQQFGLLTKTVTWPTVPGLSYRIAVGDIGTTSFEFTLTVTRDDDECESSVCTLCADGTPPDGSLSLDGSVCRDWARNATYADPSSEECLMYHLLGVKNCGCATAVEATCELCPDGSEPGNFDLPFFDFDVEPTCGDWSVVPAVDGNDTCNALRKLAFYCGCEDTEGCTICPGGATPGDPSRVVPLVSETCGYWDALTRTFDFPEECNLVSETTNFDIVGFCCEDVEPIWNCPLCREDEELRDLNLGDLTCREVLEALPYLPAEVGNCDEIQEYIGPLCCSEPDDKCPLCSDGGDYDADRRIPALDHVLPGATCGMLDAIRPEELSSSCHAIQERFGYFCGCSGATRRCSLCSGYAGDDNDDNGDGDQTTQICAGTPENPISFCANGGVCRERPADGDDPGCDCPDGFEGPQCELKASQPSLWMGAPGKVFLFSNGTSCQDVDDLMSLRPATDCSGDLLYSGTDAAAFCECQGTQAPEVCSLCGASDLINADLTIPGTNYTCAEVAEFARFVVEDRVCTSVKELIPMCCDTGRTCSICPRGSIFSMKHRSREIDFFDGFTCEEAEAAVAFVPQEACDRIIRNTPISLAYFCGCEGVPPPDLGCSLCKEGQVLLDASIAISAASSNTTCTRVAEIAASASDSRFCNDLVAEAFRECCIGRDGMDNVVLSPDSTLARNNPTEPPSTSLIKAVPSQGSSPSQRRPDSGG